MSVIVRLWNICFANLLLIYQTQHFSFCLKRRLGYCFCLSERKYADGVNYKQIVVRHLLIATFSNIPIVFLTLALKHFLARKVNLVL